MIRSPEQLFILEGTCFSPGSDLINRPLGMVLTSAGEKSKTGILQFNYQSRVTVMICVCAAGESLHPLIVLEGIPEPSFRPYTGEVSVRYIFGPRWNLNMKQDVASVDHFVFKEWVPVFFDKIMVRLKAFGKVALFFGWISSSYVIQTTNVGRGRCGYITIICAQKW